MMGVSLDRTTRRIAAAASLIAGALAMYWLIEILRNQVPDGGAHDVKVSIAYLSTLTLFFGLVARRPAIADRSTFAPLMFAPLSAVWTSRFIFKWTKHDFGLPGIMTFAVTVGLVGAAILVRERWRRGAAQPAVAADGAGFAPPLNGSTLGRQSMGKRASREELEKALRQSRGALPAWVGAAVAACGIVWVGNRWVHITYLSVLPILAVPVGQLINIVYCRWVLRRLPEARPDQ